MTEETVQQAQQPTPERPTEYSKELAKAICGRLVEDESLRSICSEPGMPDLATVASWISNNKEFRESYAFAREFQAHCIYDETIELVDEVSTQWVEKVRANGRVVRGPDRNSLPRCCLRLEVRHWVADELLARARQLSARRLFEYPSGPHSEIFRRFSEIPAISALIFLHQDKDIDMTDTKQTVDNFIATKLARLERLCGRWPVLSSENRHDYEELLISLLEYYWPRNVLAERLLKNLADEEWEIARYKRHKILLLERRFHARLAFQAYREKGSKEDKAALAKKSAEQPPGKLILAEELLDGIIPEIDAMLLRPAQELDHARALEVAIVYFQHLDRLLNAAIVRRNAVLADIERCDYHFDPRLPVSAWAEQIEQTGERRANEPESDSAKLDNVAPPLSPSQEDQS